MIRTLPFLLLPAVLLANSPQKVVRLPSVTAVIERGSQVTPDPDMAAQVERGSIAALESKGIRVERTGRADVILSIKFVRKEHLKPVENRAPAFCGDGEESQPERGILQLVITAADQSGRQLWTVRDERAYRCHAPLIEVWELALNALARAPI